MEIRTPKATYVYVFYQKVKTQERARMVKVGYFGNPRRRFQSIQGGCPFPLGIGYISSPMTNQNARLRESELLYLLSRYRVRGEWFSVPHKVFKRLLEGDMYLP